MNLKVTGHVQKILKEQSGKSKNGLWRKRNFILETEDKFPKKICITQWDEAIDEQPVEKGAEIIAYIDIQSREYRGKWYTDVKAWKVERKDAVVEAPPSAPGLTREGSREVSYPKGDVPF